MSEVATSARFLATAAPAVTRGLLNNPFRSPWSERMARVSVKLFATVREAAGVAECEVAASNLDELFDALGGTLGRGVADIIARAEHDPDSLVVLLNGRNVVPGSSERTKLADGDEVSIFPPVSGG